MRRRALTLVEVLLAGSLGLLLLGLLIQTVEISRRGWRQTINLQSAQSATLVAATRLREDFRKSKPRSASLAGPVLSFVTYDDGSNPLAWDSTGQIIWRGWVQYRWLDQKLQRRHMPLAEVAPAWEPSVRGQSLAPDLIRCEWSLAAGGLLEVRLESRSQNASSYSQLRLLAFLYGRD